MWNKHNVFDSLFDPKKSFNSPFLAGRKGDKIVLGEYTPSLDALALLIKSEEPDPEKIIKEIIDGKNTIQKLVQYHEFLHVRLTKKTSLWTVLVMYEFYSYLGFLRMLKIVEKGMEKTKMERLRKDLMDLIVINELSNRLYETWKPLHETMANVNLFVIGKLSKDPYTKDAAQSLIRANIANSNVINDLTRLSEFIIEKMGIENGWKFLISLSFQASSIDSRIIEDSSRRKPKDSEEFKKHKRERFEIGYKLRDDPLFENPTNRFIEMILLSIKCMDEIKRALKRGADPTSLATNINGLIGYKIYTIEDQINFMEKGIKRIAHDKKIIPNETTRSWHVEAEIYFNVFKELIGGSLPSFWYLNDVDSGKIIIATTTAGAKHKELLEYIHVNVLKYQFLKSIEEGKDLIECFGNRLFGCPSDCKSCGQYYLLDVTKKLYDITSDFSYEELKREGIDPDRLRDAISK